MSDIAIKLENISKQYRLGVVGTGTLSHDLNRWFARMRGKADPSLKIGQENKLSEAGGDHIWALKDINLEVKQGEILGIIGKNGAGKSTLLKLLSRVTGPTTGQIKVNGKIASLLEVGTGFHPELTGKENIFLNGAILGMTKNDIRRKLDEIVEFAGVAKYLNTPVKRYSSGMYVRLAFAVAAHLEPDILVVDEVLAVGDAEFQKKAIGKMQDVSSQGGRTVLFVSHNMASIQALCQKGIVLSNGQITYLGSAKEAVENYINLSAKTLNYAADGYIQLDDIREKVYVAKIFHKIRIVDKDNNIKESFPMLSSMKIEIELNNTENYPGMDFGISILTPTGQRITSYATWMATKKVNIPKKIILDIPSIKFSDGSYYIGLSMTHPKEGIYIDKIENAISFHIESVDVFNTGRNYTSDYGLLLPDGNFKLI